jgi:cytochrome d ubiquinol oxidase subunit I
MPLAGISIGWMFTEMARQPWIVFGLMRTADAVSPAVSTAEVGISIVVLTLLYATLAVVEVGLLRKAIKIGPPASVEVHSDAHPENDRVLTFAY